MLNKDATVRQHFTWNILYVSSKIVGNFQLQLENNNWRSMSLVSNTQDFLDLGEIVSFIKNKLGNSKNNFKFPE